jgi:hypothetical protein
MSITVAVNMLKAIRNRQLVFYGSRSSELDRVDSQLG